MNRHARQASLSELGAAGHARIRAGSALVVGLGGLGSPAAHYLAGAGVGRLGLCDFDAVDATNLHRQTLYVEADVGCAKVEAASHRLRGLDPEVKLTAHRLAVDTANARDLVRGYAVVLDCTDDPGARYALSDACVEARIPLVHAGVSRWEGVCTVLGPPGPCYRCLHPKSTEAPTCATEGVLGPIPGILGAVQAQEALKILSGAGATLSGRMLLYDGLRGESRTVSLKRRDDCMCHVALPTTDGAACPTPWATPNVTAISMAEYLANPAPYFVVDVREPWEHEEAAMPGAHLIPLGELQARLDEIPRDRPVACLCAVGGRSAHAAAYLREQGIQAVNLRGGMNAYLALT